MAVRAHVCFAALALLLLGFARPVPCVRLAELFEFGRSAGDEQLRRGSDQSRQLELETPLLFYHGTFRSVHVSYPAPKTYLPRRALLLGIINDKAACACDTRCDQLVVVRHHLRGHRRRRDTTEKVTFKVQR
ncbi:hypothetical protein Z043_100755 [Scleropages formosus]|uniref:C2H2-type domain-containing protein n=1 Tax=Scleropages formosus TaxID=113540 RepID=A0A0P7XW61_SCLFO|nr:hypothetical protein Z043_100755 [Scleropages formosus]